MAVHTIHAAFFGRGNLFRRERPHSIHVFSHIAVPILHANPRNDLSLLVRGDERDFISQVHVPMNSRHWTTRRITAADIDQHARLPERVLLVISVVTECFELSAIKLRGPMTLLASLIRGPHVTNRSFDGF